MEYSGGANAFDADFSGQAGDSKAAYEAVSELLSQGKYGEAGKELEAMDAALR